MPSLLRVGLFVLCWRQSQSLRTEVDLSDLIEADIEYNEESTPAICQRLPPGPCSPQFQALCAKECAAREPASAKVEEPKVLRRKQTHDACKKLPEGPCSTMNKALCPAECAAREPISAKVEPEVLRRKQNHDACKKLPEGPCSAMNKALCLAECAAREPVSARVEPQVVRRKQNHEACKKLPEGPCSEPNWQLCPDECFARHVIEPPRADKAMGRAKDVNCPWVKQSGQRCSNIQWEFCPEECDALDLAECKALNASCRDQYHWRTCPDKCKYLQKLRDAAQYQGLPENARLHAIQDKRMPMDDKVFTERLLAAFKKFDHEDTGVISQQELKEVLRRLSPESWDDAKLHKLDRVLDNLDTRGDGQIRYEEFASWVTGGQQTGSLAKQPKVDSLTKDHQRGDVMTKRTGSEDVFDEGGVYDGWTTLADWTK